MNKKVFNVFFLRVDERCAYGFYCCCIWVARCCFEGYCECFSGFSLDVSCSLFAGGWGFIVKTPIGLRECFSLWMGFVGVIEIERLEVGLSIGGMSNDLWPVLRLGSIHPCEGCLLWRLNQWDRVRRRRVMGQR